MRSVVRGLGLGVALLLSVAGGTALAGDGSYNVTIQKPTVRVHPDDPSGGSLVVATRLSSAKRGCYVSREVSLYQEHGSIDIKRDTDYTDSGGRAVFYAYGPQAFYYVRAEKKHNGGRFFCPSRRSPVSSAF